MVYLIGAYSSLLSLQLVHCSVKVMSTVTERRGTIGTVKGTGENEVLSTKSKLLLEDCGKG